MARGTGLYVLAFAVLTAAAPARADDPRCRAIRCSDHGQCLVEDGRPFCFCEDGYAARALTCVPEGDHARAHQPGSREGARAVQIAEAEADRGPRDVGRPFDGAPYDLGRYLAPGELWCSEFISWVYRRAGIEFSGGYEGGWLLTNNAAIRLWFERQERYVAFGTPEWRTFQPRPGDYVRFHTRRGHGHSAIVRFVSGDTLYTVEGNVGNHVRLRTHRRFRSDRRIDGIGIVTQPDVRRLLIARTTISPAIPVRARRAP